jgi:hypothetical protein
MLNWLRSRRRRRGDRGAVAVEAALVTPIILILVFGIIEFAFLLRDHVAVTSAVRTGARVASTAADDGTCSPNPLDDVPCPANGSPMLAQLAADAIQRAGSVMPEDTVDYIMIYKANAAGYPGTGSSLPSSCTGVPSCVQYKWRANQDRFRYLSGNWDSRTISACFPGSSAKPLDSVGVAMVAKHKMFTGMFGSQFNLVDRASMNFEPLPTQTCGSMEHP